MDARFDWSFSIEKKLYNDLKEKIPGFTVEDFIKLAHRFDNLKMNQMKAYDRLRLIQHKQRQGGAGIQKILREERRKKKLKKHIISLESPVHHPHVHKVEIPDKFAIM